MNCTRLRRALLCVLPAFLLGSAVKGQVPLPKVAEGWKIEQIAEAPAILFPTAVVVAPDGTIYLGQDPMDMPGPATQPIDSVVAIKGGKITKFAEGLWAVMGLEWIDGALYVVHAPYLSRFRDTNGDGKADERVDLVTGLGPKIPGFSGVNDHIASGVRLGMDGFLYIAVGDKGIPKATGLDGKTITLKGGGVVRVRPDGSDLEIVSTGERNPLSVALTDRDEIFTYGNDDDSKKWPNSLTHHIVGGHYGYPFEFLNAPWRALPITAGLLGGSGTQGLSYNEGGLPEKYRGGLFFCEWGQQKIFHYAIDRKGATFKAQPRVAIVEAGDVSEFRPLSIALDVNSNSFIISDWAFAKWLADGPKTGRLYRLSYVGSDRPAVSKSDQPSLESPSLRARLQMQRSLAKLGDRAVPGLAKLLASEAGATSRIHAVWTLDAIPSADAATAIRQAFGDKNAEVRSQAARSRGIRRDKAALSGFISLLRDEDAVVRREAAIALGRIGDVTAGAALMALIGDRDAFVAWSARKAIRDLNAFDADAVVAALEDPARRESALALTDESWSPAAIQGLAASLAKLKDAKARARVVANLAGQYRKYPAWNGFWFGTNPLAGEFPTKSVDWDLPAMAAVAEALKVALADADALVRRQAIIGLANVGQGTIAALRTALASETDETNRGALVAAYARLRDPLSPSLFIAILKNSEEKLSVRAAALDALATINSRPAFNARFALLFDPQAPPELVARALPALGRTGALPANDLAGFLTAKSSLVRLAALVALSEHKTLPEAVRTQVIDRLSDSEFDVRLAAVDAVARLRIHESVDALIKLTADPVTRDPAAIALCGMPDVRALPIYLDLIGERNPESRRAAEIALISLRDLVGDELKERLKSGKIEVSAASAIERVLTRFRPITDWKVIGPFARTTAQVFIEDPKIDFAKAHSGVEGRPILWTERKGDPRTGRVVIDDFKAGKGDRGGFGFDTNGSPDLAAFVYAEIQSESDRPAMLLVGSSGGVVLTVNEKIVHNYSNFSGRSYSPDSDVLRVRLVKGTNRILLRVRQGIGVWSFGVQVSDPLDLPGLEKARGNDMARLAEFALATPGDARRGETLFFDAKGVGCVKCHAANGRGTGNVGPDLTGLALKYDKAEIVRSVLEPSNRIATGYQPVVVSLADGRVITGLVKSETETHLELVESETKVTRVAKSEIDERRVGTVSVMPTGLAETLTPADFSDLVAYLLSLKTATKP